MNMEQQLWLLLVTSSLVASGNIRFGAPGNLSFGDIFLLSSSGTGSQLRCPISYV
jgi:hypothetical protein